MARSGCQAQEKRTQSGLQAGNDLVQPDTGRNCRRFRESHLPTNGSKDERLEALGLFRMRAEEKNTTAAELTSDDRGGVDHRLGIGAILANAGSVIGKDAWFREIAVL